MLFDWDEGNRGHFAKHGVSIEEAEEAMLNDPLEAGWQFEEGEERFVQVGETNAGRILMVVTTFRDPKVRIITALDPPKAMKQAYLDDRRRRSND